ncbi:hypothetical protein [Streptomyces sp. NBC_01353]|uniref:hypothetical protein n=1 Tax=Streptomyces sp. NBC_01353 TaxID=2903835 RepID=UPI002E30E4F3|nr:hypothetical protein [Streptomyces sp. NBC_01353]
MDRENRKLCAADMGRHASEFVERAAVRSRLPLDYSVTSLRIVDRLIDGLRQGGGGRERVNGALTAIGAYVGEVLVREAGAVWVDLPPEHLLRSVFGHPVGVRMPDGRMWNPLGRTVNRFEVGPQESLHTYFLTLHGRRSPRTRRREGASPTGCRRRRTDGLTGLPYPGSRL